LRFGQIWTISDAERRDLKRKIANKRREVEILIDFLLYSNVMLSYFDDGHAEECHVISSDGSGPPSNWRSLVRTRIDQELSERGLDPVHPDTPLSLLRAARRLGRVTAHELDEACLFARQSELRSLLEQLSPRRA
jgi:hypothetical protein